jgi:hypothetical protein
LNDSPHPLYTRFQSSTNTFAKTLFWTFRLGAFGGELHYEANKQKNSILGQSRLFGEETALLMALEDDD